MMMQSNEEEIVIMYFSAQSPIDGTTIFEREIPMTKRDRKELDDKVKEYSTEFKRIFDTLCPQFDIRLSVIGSWLKGQNKPIPQKEEFLNWFISKKIGCYSFGFNEYEDTESGQSVQETNISIPDFTKMFIPRLIDDYLLEFCKQYSDELKRKDLQLSKSPALKVIEAIKKKVGRPKSKNVAERNQLIHNDYLKLKIDGITNVKGTLLDIHKNIFNHPNHETNRKNLDRIIQKKEQKTKDIN